MISLNHDSERLVYMNEEQSKRIKALASEAAKDTRRVMEALANYPEGWPDDPSDWFHG